MGRASTPMTGTMTCLNQLNSLRAFFQKQIGNATFARVKDITEEQ